MLFALRGKGLDLGGNLYSSFETLKGGRQLLYFFQLAGWEDATCECLV